MKLTKGEIKMKLTKKEIMSKALSILNEVKNIEFDTDRVLIPYLLDEKTEEDYLMFSEAEIIFLTNAIILNFNFDKDLIVDELRELTKETE